MTTPQPSVRTAHKPRWRRKRDDAFTESAKRHLEPGETVREIFMGCAGFPVVGLGWTSKRLIVVTDRNVYQFSKGRGSHQVKAVRYKARLGEVAAHPGFAGSLKVGEAPRVYVTQDSGLGVRKQVAALINEVNTTAHQQA
jgi:hypothetical protein